MDEKFEERTGEYEEREDHRLKHAGAIALFLLSFIIIALICWLLSAMLRKKQGKKTVLTRTNSLLGGAFGLVKGCLFLVLVSGVWAYLAGNDWLPKDNGVYAFFADSAILEYMETLLPTL